jgi:biotin operon repressor
MAVELNISRRVVTKQITNFKSEGLLNELASIKVVTGK